MFVADCFLSAPAFVAHDRVSVFEKRYTLIGLTALGGTPVVCILIIRGKQKDLSDETGIDIILNPEGDPKDGDTYFFIIILEQENTSMVHQHVDFVVRIYWHCLSLILRGIKVLQEYKK